MTKLDHRIPRHQPWNDWCMIHATTGDHIQDILRNGIKNNGGTSTDEDERVDCALIQFEEFFPAEVAMYYDVHARVPSDKIYIDLDESDFIFPKGITPKYKMTLPEMLNLGVKDEGGVGRGLWMEHIRSEWIRSITMVMCNKYSVIHQITVMQHEDLGRMSDYGWDWLYNEEEQQR